MRLDPDFPQSAGSDPLAGAGEDTEKDRIGRLNGVKQTGDILTVDRDHAPGVGLGPQIGHEVARDFVAERHARHRVLAQMGRLNMRLSKQWMTCTAQEAAAQGCQGFHLQILGGAQRTQIDGNDVNRLVAQRLQQHVDRAAGNLDLDRRLTRCHLAQEGHKQDRGRRRAKADRNTAELSLLEQRDATSEFGGLEQDAPGALHDLSAIGGEAVVFAGTIDQLHPEFFFQCPQAAAERWLGDAYRIGRLAKGAVLGECDQVAELAQIH